MTKIKNKITIYSQSVLIIKVDIVVPSSEGIESVTAELDPLSLLNVVKLNFVLCVQFCQRLDDRGDPSLCNFSSRNIGLNVRGDHHESSFGVGNHLRRCQLGATR